MNVKSRMMFHFFAQLFFTFIAVFTIGILLFMFLISFLIKDELKENPKMAIVENLPIMTILGVEEDIKIRENWQQKLKDEKMWLQILNEQGNVIHQYNTPEDLQETYSINELLAIEENKKLGPYTIEPYFESFASEPYYYLFGYVEEQQQILASWYESYSMQGDIIEDKVMELEKLVVQQEGMLDIYQEGKLIHRIGEKLPLPNSPLATLGSVYLPGNYETKAYVLNVDSASWIFYERNDTYKTPYAQLLLNRELEIILAIALISLLIPILLSLWNGYRYGKPLILFIDWLKIIEEKRYDDLLAGREHAKIFKKNGKVKFRYRLYKEVFVSFAEMSKRLACAEHERKQLEKTREEWMAGISHDLRTPLSSVQGYGHLLESGQYDFSKEELQQMGQVIRDKSDYMVGLVEDFSLIFQLKNSTVTIQKELVNLNEFIGSLVYRYKDDVTLDDYSFSFIPAEADCEANIDPKWFTRVMDNLLSNATKHNPSHTNIEVQVFNKNDKRIIRISDNGQGMDDDFVRNLFNRYYRGTSTNERSEGEGLGMSIAYAIVELHGGQIHVQSEVGKGTVIDIELI